MVWGGEGADLHRARALVLDLSIASYTLCGLGQIP